MTDRTDNMLNRRIQITIIPVFDEKFDELFKHFKALISMIGKRTNTFIWIITEVEAGEEE